MQADCRKSPLWCKTNPLRESTITQTDALTEATNVSGIITPFAIKDSQTCIIINSNFQIMQVADGRVNKYWDVYTGCNYSFQYPDLD